MLNILIGTKNKYKAEEMVAFLGDISEIKIYFLADTNINIKIEENQKTLKKNAEKKAIELSKLTDFYVLTSDSGIDIPGLGNKWDILRNQRIVGEFSSDLEKANKLLELMKDLKGEERRATNHFAMALALKGNLLWSDQQIIERAYIIEELPDREIPQYKWMSHVWYYPQYNKVLNKLNDEEKEELRIQAVGIKNSLRKKIEEILLLNRD